MQKPASMLLALGATLLASQASAGPISTTQLRPGEAPPRDLPVAGVVTQPDWIRKPSADDLGKFYPPFAAFLGISGHLILSCTVTAVGGLKDCSAGNETPMGFRFAQAGIAMTTLFQMRPLSIDGNPVSGGIVRIPLTFAMPQVPHTAPVSTPASASAKALAAAHRMAQAIMGQAIPPQIARWDEYLGRMNGSHEELLGLESARKSYVAGMPLLVEQVSAAFVKIYSEKELTDIAAFLETPSGRAWISHQPDADRMARAGLVVATAEINKATRAELCAQIACVAVDRGDPKPPEMDPK